MKELLNNKKLIGVYILWFTIHLIILIITWGSQSYRSAENFWPFAGSYEGDLSRAYDLTEFLFYTIIPVFLIIAIHFLQQSKNEK
ncbi:MAG: hypothetical protein IPI93_11300 [Sphingobacteriaceae bacterium]|nr:hypothetical protein [Sphingobacteriaceae bacterium]